ncbi:DNA polymerase III subunit beta [Facklamia hominis]|uniref:Beta sliding clamp n=1 Tax=Facklamia hominis CCUG 36813 TaxID=883111 RepID=K1MFW9_9LACT|nr:DNA polymerase III subunit beta [Facklamia hominis]EKB54914.1 DNA polymerase III, beta subunit [Facklamia hominis CCUG 36813]RYC98629.1 DNA polymerase III subunit beta [Facklamia hominis]WPJ90830.1 DNA polymerase III subunit beta [Facklamia hominis]
MKFTINRSKLIQELSNVQRAIPGKTSMEILLGIKLNLTSNGLYLLGSDSEISIESFINVNKEDAHLKIEETGSVVLPARLLNDIVKKLASDEVKIEVETDYVTKISAANAEFKIIGINAEDFPHLPTIEEQSQIILPAAQLKKVIDQTIFSASNQELKPSLTGLYLAIDKDQLTAVATDSHRLSQRKLLLENQHLSGITPMILPKKTVKELARVVPDYADIKMTIASHQVVFQFENITVYSRLIDGTYPDASRLIPTEFNTEVVLNAQYFSGAMDRASLMSHEGKNNIVQLSIEDQHVELKVLGAEIGNVTEEIEYQELVGENIKISFNPDYMNEALKSFGDQTICLQLISPVRTMLLKAYPEKDSKNALLQLLTPIRTHTY